jgi:chemotaxis protein CheY-P-specific phosphatase CheC
MTFPKDFRPVLAEQLGRILEETAFMLVENPDATMPEPCETIESQIAFTGETNGVCWLVVPKPDALTLAGEMLGAQTTSSPQIELACNAVGELLNILTAWVLDAWLSGDKPHSLGLPITQIVPLESTRIFSVTPKERVIVATDSGNTFLACITEE